MEAYAGRQFVGIDLHRRRSVVVRMTDGGEVLETVRILNDAQRLAEVLHRCGEAPEVVMEATYGWYWVADVIAGEGARLHLAHPLGVKAFEYRRVNNDERDAGDLADLLRMGRLPEAWIAPPEIRELREAVRHRAKLVALRSHCKAEIHAVLAKLACWCGLTPKHHESDTHVHRGAITKQASRLVRWAAVESVQILPKNSTVGAFRDRIAANRGRNIGAVAAARKQIGHVYHALRDHHARPAPASQGVCGMSRTGSRSARVVQVMTPSTARSPTSD